MPLTTHIAHGAQSITVEWSDRELEGMDLSVDSDPDVLMEFTRDWLLGLDWGFSVEVLDTDDPDWAIKDRALADD